MIEIEDVERNIAKVSGGTISKPSRSMTVGELELALLRRFPREDAEEWDRMGLLVGDPAELVKGVMVALDPTASAIDAAQKAGANVLLTHHPAFLEPPAVLSPSREIATAQGANAFNAVRKGVSLMNFHTALDVSREALALLPDMLSMDFEGVLVPAGANTEKGYGQLCRVRKADDPFTLERLVARCTSVFGRPPRMWGEGDTRLERVVIANGSAGNVVEACVREGVDCLVCGEVRYHAALDAAQAGLCIVELGHDVSELPLVAVLARAAVAAGIDSSLVSVFEQGSNWTTHESTRL